MLDDEMMDVGEGDAHDFDGGPAPPDEGPGQDYPPDRPIGARPEAFAADGSVVVDDVATRERRLEPEHGIVAAPIGGIDLLASTDDPDVEAELVGEEPDDAAGPGAPAEVAAVHLVTDEGRPLDDRR